MNTDVPPLKPRRRLWPWFVASSLVLLVAIPNLPMQYRGPEVLIAAVGGLWALAFYLHGQQGEDARFLKELLSEFNRRYNELNDKLRGGFSYQREFEAKFIDYFNLCAEEWVFWKGGYIPDGIWLAWENGMSQYGRDPRVKQLWEQERKSNSYYGFEFPINASPGMTGLEEAKASDAGGEKQKAYDVDAIRRVYPQAYEKWSHTDDDRLRELFLAGKSVDELADDLKRQPGAIRSRLSKLSLTGPES